MHIGIKSRKKLIAFEKDALKWLFLQKEYKACWLRARYFLYRKTHKKMDKIWLISDRTDKAGDNGEALFKYLSSNKPKGIRPIFVISKYSIDYERIKKIGETICYEDKKYELYFLLADKIISSSEAEYVINPFQNNRKYFVDLFKFKFVFLQHGIIMNDLSSCLQRYKKNISMFITSAPKEYNSILFGNYMYDEQVKLTGLARFDYLENNPKKQLLILPTWRRSISQSYESETRSVYFDGFKETEYFHFYNQLINDPRLLEVMRKNGYDGVFCLHPIHEKQHIDFDGNDVFSINHGFVDYPKRFSEASLMVTDYSSVFFDFCYLKKPVIYAQFDKDAFFNGAVYDEGYFSYERDGFGPVCYDLDSTINEIIHVIENDCKMDLEYVSKTEVFYAFNDRNNCQRICDEILKLN